jgi:hypothetical protein
MAESGGVPSAQLVTNREDSRGLWQINIKAWPKVDAAQLFDPQYNARTALAVYKAAKGWSPWSVYKDGVYKKFMPAAKAAPSSGFTTGQKLFGLALAAAIVWKVTR